MAYRGMAYRWGGRSAATGFDCSGLVQTVCAKWGIYLPRVASAQYHSGVPVSRDQLQPGDLVFFKNTYKRGLSHVGIYIGDGCFIHAAGRSYGVCIGRLDKGYHKNHWAGARRLNLSRLPAVPGETTRIDTITVDTDVDPWASERQSPSTSTAQPETKPAPASAAPVAPAPRQTEVRTMPSPLQSSVIPDHPTADRPASLDRPITDRPRGL
jgi:hypothetical protein